VCSSAAPFAHLAGKRYGFPLPGIQREAAMKSMHRKFVFAAAALAAAGTVNAQQPQESIIVTPRDDAVYVKTDGMPTFLAERVEQEAQKGLRALSHYVQRTQAIHHLYLPDLLVTREQAEQALAQGQRPHLVAVALDETR
jgi:hypothetical protein